MKNLIFKILDLHECDHCGIVFTGKIWEADTYNPSSHDRVELCQRCGDPWFAEAVIENKPLKRKRPPEPPYIATTEVRK
jgi:hypothetical protein